ncbi:MAG: glycosyltransferase, partial [Actinomycetota bacterium]|nr:glycosyltransferase [Actinomycetota bacterium]
MGRPRVSVVVPVHNEAERLPACLEAIAAQDLPPEWVEVLVVDGGSGDGTDDVARRLLADRPWAGAAVLHSASGDRSSNLNVGLDGARAPVLVRVDGRSRIPPHYLGRCLDVLERRPDVAVVGGSQRAVAPAGRPAEVGVARALNNRWATGLARYRRAAGSGEADTVYLGAYRVEQLRAVGGWHRDLAVNEDFDLNRRLRRFGTVWFDAGLAVDYVPRSSLRALLRQYWDFGVGKARYWRVSGDRPRPRQVVLLTAPAVAAAGFVAVLAALGPTAAASFAAAGVALAVAV